MGRARASVHKGQKCDEHGRSSEADNINGVLEFSLRFLSGVCAWNSHDELPRERAGFGGFPPPHNAPQANAFPPKLSGGPGPQFRMRFSIAATSSPRAAGLETRGAPAHGPSTVGYPP